MCRITFTTFFVALCLSVYATPIRFTATYLGGSAADELLDVAYAPDGTLVVAGSTVSTDWSFPSGTQSHVLGTEGAVSSTIFIARLSNDAKQLLSFTRFAYGSVKSKDVRIAVTANGIYVVAVGYELFKQLPGFDGKLDDVAGQKPFVARLSVDGSTLLNATYLGGGDSDRDVNDVDVFPNGDICVSHDSGSGLGNGIISRINSDLSNSIWSKTYTVWCGEARLNAVAVSPDGDMVYVGGYGMGHTGKEPYKDPLLFAFNGSDGTQRWKRGTDNRDYGVFNFPQDSIGANRLISDSQINVLGTDNQGNAITAGYSDGGATVFTKDPWFGGYSVFEGASLPATVQDGDSFSGFSGATSVSTAGRMDKNGNWIRSHRFKPTSIWNEMYGVCATSDDKIFFVGKSVSLPEMNNWDMASGAGAVLLKMDMDAAGGNRRFVTHIAGVDALNKIARDRSSYRYAVVGRAKTTDVYTVNAVQTTFGGGTTDGYLLVLDDNEKPSSTSVEITTNADVDVKFGTKTNNNYGAALVAQAKRRDSRPDETSKMYIKFDLSGITEPIQRAKLQVYKPEKYSAGYLTVYALKEGNETWAENTITWNNAPGNLTASPSYMDMTKVDSIGSWQIKSSGSAQVETFESAVFSQYIENARLNGDKSVTLVLTSYNPVEQDKAALQAATKENTSSFMPPRLQIELAPKASVLSEILFYPNVLTLKIGDSKKIQTISVDQYGAQLLATVSLSVDKDGVLSNDGMFTATKAGDFVVTASSGNVSNQLTVVVNPDLTATNKIIATNNPIIVVKNKMIQIRWENHENFNVEILNAMGEVMISRRVQSNTFTEISTLNKGIYIARLNKDNYKTQTKFILR
ncbi:MAG: hypothetical protein AUK44_10450 [Porphyromonadaceae bacterium CG2_30_38_12]|nr:MAG: hypothetical protein AUK44_10450 [Porphyromonadaceae bacterium CG2_30_38_12]